MTDSFSKPSPDSEPRSPGDSPVATALAGYLKAVPAASSWEDAVARRAPLVTGRRGKPEQWLNAGLRYHNSLVRTQSLSYWVAAQVNKGASFGGPVTGGAALYGQLLSLPGIIAVGSGTALDEPGKVHRLQHWVRVDSEIWPVTVEPELAARLDDPWAAAGVARGSVRR
jgi:hypothetical protein